MKKFSQSLIALLAIFTVAAANAQEIHIKARFIEVPKETFEALQKNFEVASDGTELLTPEQMRSTLKSLRSDSSVKILAEPEVVTTSGRQTQMRATKEIKIVNGISFETQYDDQNISTNNNAISFKTQPFEMGPVLDTVSTVLNDNYTIDLRAKPSLAEFFGYATPTNSFPHGYVSEPTISPVIQIQKTDAHVKLRDGQTLALFKFKSESTVAENLPKHEDKELLVLVTVTLVDSDGNRIHSDN